MARKTRDKNRGRSGGSGGGGGGHPANAKPRDKKNGPHLEDLYLPLLPFKLVMKTILKKKGVTPASKMADLVHQFHDIIIEGKKKQERFESFAPELIQAVIKAIISFITGLKNKVEKAKEQKAKGEPVTDPPSKEEEKIVELADKGVQAAKDSAKEEATFQLGKYTPWIIAAFVIVLIFVSKGK